MLVVLVVLVLVVAVVAAAGYKPIGSYRGVQCAHLIFLYWFSWVKATSISLAQL